MQATLTLCLLILLTTVEHVAGVRIRKDNLYLHRRQGRQVPNASREKHRAPDAGHDTMVGLNITGSNTNDLPVQTALPHILSETQHMVSFSDPGEFAVMALASGGGGWFACSAGSLAIILFADLLSGRNPVKRLQGLKLVQELLRNAFGTLVLTTSYDLMVSFGYGAFESGCFIGCIYAVASISACGMWYHMNRVGLQHRGSILLCCYTSACFCAVAFACAAQSAAVWRHSHVLLGVMVSARMLAGLVIGMLLVIETNTVSQVTPAQGMVQFGVLRGAGKVAGLGLGPLMTALTSSVMHPTSIELRVAYSAWTLVSLYVPLLMAAFFLMPNNFVELASEKCRQDAEWTAEVEESPDGTVKVETLSSAERRQIWILSLMFGIQRSFSSASIESATSFILENEFKWRLQSIGVAVGGSFVIGAVLMCIFRALQQGFQASETRALRLSASLSVIGGLLFLPGTGKILSGLSMAISSPETNPHQEYIAVLTADCLLFPCFFFANGLLEGLAFRCSTSGTMTSVDNYVLAQVGFQQLMRCIASGASRFILDRHGRFWYALVQVFLSATGLTVCLRVGRGLEAKQTPFK